MILSKIVRYSREIQKKFFTITVTLKQAEPNQATDYVRYNRVLVVTVIVITEFDCISKVSHII